MLEPRHELLTANNQTPYVVTFFDLRRGPMVLDVPPAGYFVVPSETVFVYIALHPISIAKGTLADAVPIASV